MTLSARRRLGSVAVAVLVLTTGCGPNEPDDPDPGPATTTTTSEATEPTPTPPPTPEPTTPDPAPVTIPPIALGQWLPAAPTCRTGETEVPQPPDLQTLLRVCRAADNATITFVNTSGTTLGFDTVGWPRASFFGIGETELAQSLLRQSGLLVREANDALWLPARFSTRLEDAGRITEFRVFTDFQHGQRVAQTRAMGRLVSQIPYAPPATESASEQLAGGVTSCLGAEGDTPLEKLLEETEPCQKLVEKLIEDWNEKQEAEVRAGREPAHTSPVPADDLRLTLARRSRELDQFVAPLSKIRISVSGRSIRIGG
ncbi:hypothetical protein [Knoellia aerolata]|uniref:Uncharacterized protein n=1 Tax=Knoellia aerolata DSM 18566 TaxID=1385519 RepID=A0A0A0JZC0_9MICO|nr:hypothetical protein [Knoellia aerolata]KGN40896.1 hypothetical protein N801_10570 [Knoellia aerolata DSM 18566]